MQPGWAPRPVPPTDAKAVVALVLGILCVLGSPCWLGLPLGVPALILGVLAHRDIRRSDGLAGGSGIATAGIVLGSLGSLFFVCTAAFWVVMLVRHPPTVTTSPAVPAISPTGTATAVAPPLIPPGGWGVIHVVALHPAPPETLGDQLAEETKAAKAASETVLVETISPSCPACVEIALAMRDPELQSVLAHVRVVHVDVTEYGTQARSLKLAERYLPWFYLLDARGKPMDAISADEWDDNVAENIAPPLEAFLNRKLTARRTPWHGTSL
jgi:hypothetical protein